MTREQVWFESFSLLVKGYGDSLKRSLHESVHETGFKFADLVLSEFDKRFSPQYAVYSIYELPEYEYAANGIKIEGGYKLRINDPEYPQEPYSVTLKNSDGETARYYMNGVVGEEGSKVYWKSKKNSILEYLLKGFDEAED